MSKKKSKKDEPPPRSPLASLAVALGAMLALAGLLRVLDVFIGQNVLALPIAGAIAAELIAGNAGVVWFPPGFHATLGGLARVVARGAAPVLIAVALVVAIAKVLGLAEIDAGSPGATLGFALVRSAAIGARDELLFRGLPFVAAESGKLPRRAAIVFGAVAGAASLALMPGVTATAIVLELAAGLAFALLWSWGPLVAVAAHAVWVFLIGAGLHGGLLAIAWKSGALTFGAHAAGTPALLAAFAIVGVTVAFELQARRRADPADPPAAA